VAPLLAAGLSVRAIAATTGIPVGAVHRAKRHIEKAGQAAAPPSSYVTQQAIDGVPHDVRKLTIEVYERAVNAAVGRGLLDHGDRDKPWTVTSALFASMFDDYTLDWLRRRGWQGDRGKAEAIIDAVNRLIIQLPS
jgi:hypothetical protein